MVEPERTASAAVVDPSVRYQVSMVDSNVAAACWYGFALPPIGPGLVATSAHGFIPAWNEFIITNTFNDQTQQNLMARLLQNQTPRGTFWEPLRAGSILTAIPVVIFFLIIQRHIATGLTAGAVKG